MAKINSLTFSQRIQLADWFRKMLPEFKQENPTIAEAMAAANDDLSFKVTGSNLKTMCNEFGGDWSFSRKRSPAAGDRTRRMIRIIERFMLATGYEIPADDRAWIDYQLQRGREAG